MMQGFHWKQQCVCCFLAALNNLDLDSQMEILVKAGIGNTEIAKVTVLTAKAVGVRKVRMDKKKGAK